MRRRRFLAMGPGVLAGVTGCGTLRGGRRPGGRLSLVTSALRGSDGDGLARAFARAARESGAAETVEIGNEPEAALTMFASPPGTPVPAPPGLLVTGLGELVATQVDHRADVLDAATPVSRLAGDPQVLLVLPGSGFHAFEDLADELRRDPGAVRVAGGATGGVEHVLLGLIGHGLGVDVRLLDYETYPGPDGASLALSDGRVAALIGGARAWRRRITDGTVRALAVSSAQRLTGIAAPSLRECGVRIDYADWYGVLGPADMAVAALADAVARCDHVCASAYWERTCRNKGWTSMHLSGDDFRLWLGAELARVGRALHDLGLLRHPFHKKLG
jgi:putative tricarboxylic transport membrane protein